MINTLAAGVAGFQRIQFTPDLMPSDITGTNVIEEDHDRQRVTVFQRRPIFANCCSPTRSTARRRDAGHPILQTMQEKE